METCVARPETPRRLRRGENTSGQLGIAWETMTKQPDFHCCRAVAGAQLPHLRQLIRCGKRVKVSEVTP
jgi:hypothetical protein